MSSLTNNYQCADLPMSRPACRQAGVAMSQCGNLKMCSNQPVTPEVSGLITSH